MTARLLQPGAATLLAVLAAMPGLALAHHYMDNQLPGTLMQGLLSGIAHPLIGIDHAAFIVASGLLLARVPRGWWAIASLVTGSLVGAILHLNGASLPSGELAVAASVILIGVLVVLEPRIGAQFAAAMLLAAGVLHGYAYAETIVGAETTPLLAYLAGFSAIQFLVCAAASGCYRIVMRHSPGRARFIGATAGAAAMAIGVGFLVGT